MLETTRSKIHFMIYKRLQQDLNNQIYMDVEIILIDKFNNQKNLKYHKNILGLQSNMFNNMFTFDIQKNTFTLDCLECVNSAEQSILSLYDIQPIVKSVIDALNLIKSCDYFQINFNTNWLSTIKTEDYGKYPEILSEILYYLEMPNHLSDNTKTTSQFILALKYAYQIDIDTFFYTISNSDKIYVNNNKYASLVCDKYTNNTKFACYKPIETFQMANNSNFTLGIIQNNFLFSLNLLTKKITKLLKLPSQKFIIHENIVYCYCEYNEIKKLRIHDYNLSTKSKLIAELLIPPFNVNTHNRTINLLEISNNNEIIFETITGYNEKESIIFFDLTKKSITKTIKLSETVYSKKKTEYNKYRDCFVIRSTVGFLLKIVDKNNKIITIGLDGLCEESVIMCKTKSLMMFSVLNISKFILYILDLQVNKIHEIFRSKERIIHLFLCNNEDYLIICQLGCFYIYSLVENKIIVDKIVQKNLVCGIYFPSNFNFSNF